MSGVELIEKELDGRKIAYCNKTDFLVQVGHGSKGGYKTRWSFLGDLPQAVFYYNSINVGRGFKKRLLAPSLNKPLLARQFS